MKETIKDGRRNNGLKPGENRGQGKKRTDPTGEKRVKAAPTFLKADLDWLRETAKTNGVPMTKVLDAAIKDYRGKHP